RRDSNPRPLLYGRGLLGSSVQAGRSLTHEFAAKPALLRGRGGRACPPLSALKVPVSRKCLPRAVSPGCASRPTGTLGGRPPGSRAAVGRLIDVMLIHVMRAWLRVQKDDATDGWLLALRDPVVAQAMNAIHQRPREPWTIESLAREVSVSRATLARRF